MAGYVIADVNVHDADTFSEYRNQVEPTVELYGGEYIVRGGELAVSYTHLTLPTIYSV